VATRRARRLDLSVGLGSGSRQTAERRLDGLEKKPRDAVGAIPLDPPAPPLAHLPAEIGVATADALALSNAGPEAALKQLRSAYADAADAGKFLIMLGG